MASDSFEPVPCPITDCPTAMTGFDLYEHLEDEHDPDELVTRLVELARDLPYHCDVECQKCGTHGARPGDHPLCEACEREIGLRC
jgi:hypothetical protein